MSLKTILSTKRGLASQLAKSINVSPTTIHEWASGKKQIPEGRCVQVEQFFKGLIRCEVLRPDIADKFSYLRKTKRAA